MTELPLVLLVRAVPTFAVLLRKLRQSLNLGDGSFCVGGEDEPVLNKSAVLDGWLILRE
ncbi:MAG: hypothetical protein K2Y32_22495 [Candidatus Obscuribacterales bacterium]|nr:hypothetical protein [Candidatus Obscuribacterales bacterium]